MAQELGRCVSAALSLVGGVACRLAGAAPPAAAAALPGPTPEVTEERDVPYYRGRPADAGRHRLDLFLPKGRQGYPVVVLVHGGSWMLGDKSSFGLYSAVGRFFARHGVGAVLPNYRLSPLIRHPEHVKDVARAVAWVHAQVAAYGGDPGRLFLAGHSAGGHLVALLATDGRYLEAEGLRPEDVRGVIGVSGVYRIPAGRVDVTLGGSGPAAVRLDQMLSLPGLAGWYGTRVLALPGIPLTVNFFSAPFGDDAELRAQASPLSHVRPGLPPFLLFSAEKDLPLLPSGAEDFCAALREVGCDARLVVVKGRNHSSILFAATRPDDPVAHDMLEFIHRHGC
jgi:acetyl esterase/lipase